MRFKARIIFEAYETIKREINMAKSEVKKGMRGVALDGKTLRFTHGNVGLFSQAGYEKLLEQKRIQMGSLIEADGLIGNYLGNADILNLALFYGLLADQSDAKLDDMSSMVDAWTEAGHSLLELRRKIIEAFKLATDPSGVVSMLENWKLSDKQEAIEDWRNSELAKERIESGETLQKKVKDLKKIKTDGLNLPGLAESS